MILRLAARFLAAIVLVPLGLAGAIVAAGSLLSACELLRAVIPYSQDSWIGQTLSYWSWMVGALIAYGSYLGLVWVFKGSDAVSEKLEKLPKGE